VESGSPLDRIVVVDAPPNAPGHCAICGTTSGPMVDFGMFMEFYGYVYFCVDNCMVQLANAFEYHSPRQWKMLMSQVQDQRDELNQLRDQNEQLRNAVDTLTPLASLHLIDSVPELDMDKVLSEEPRTELSHSEPDPEQLAFDFGEGEERKDGTPESNDESGLAGILDSSRDDSLDEFFRNL